jgi:hypothetical protein
MIPIEANISISKNHCRNGHCWTNRRFSHFEEIGEIQGLEESVKLTVIPLDRLSLCMSFEQTFPIFDVELNGGIGDAPEYETALG